MKTELSLQSQLDPAGLEGSSFITFSMSFSDIDSRRAFYCYFLILFDFRSSKGAHWAPKWLPNGIQKMDLGSHLRDVVQRGSRGAILVFG